jgi:hypothetical protein
MDVEATTAIRQAEVGAAKTMLDRTVEQFDVTPSRLVADGGYGSAEMIEWLVDERGIKPHVKLMDKSERTDGTFSRSDFAYDPDRNLYVCPGGKELRKYHRAFTKPRDGLTKDGTMIYFAVRVLCAQAQVLCERSRTQNRALRSRSRSRPGPRDRKDRGLRRFMSGTKEGRDALRSSEAHPQARSIAPAWPERGQRRAPLGRHSPKSAETGEAHPLPGGDLRHMRRRLKSSAPDGRRDRYALSPDERVLQRNLRIPAVRCVAVARWCPTAHIGRQERTKALLTSTLGGPAFGCGTSSLNLRRALVRNDWLSVRKEALVSLSDAA